MEADLLLLALSATGLAMVLRKFLAGRLLPTLVVEALACDVCSAFWSTLFLTLTGAGADMWTALFPATAVAALLLRVYSRLDPGPDPSMWKED